MSANRLAALTGLGFVVLAVAGVPILSEPPDPSEDSIQEIVNFYKDKETEVWISAWMSGVAAVLLVFYAGYLSKVLRAASGPGHMLSSVVLAGATIVALAAGLDATINIALVEAVDDIQPAAAQSLSALWSNDWIPFVIGSAIFMLASGLSIVRHGGLPKWLGWAAIVLGVVALTPAGFVGFLGAGLWVAVTSVILFLRADEPVTPGTVPPPTQTHPA